MEEQAVPSRRKCGAAAAYYLAVEAQPEYRQRQRELEVGTAQRMALGPEALAPEAPITIPVVVHVVYNDDSENISNDQIQSQITVLNQDYGAQNADKANVPDVWEALVTDTNIRFVLASEDPAGNSTSGITRTQTNRTGFGINDAVKSADTGGTDPWPTDRYLNMWACTLDGGLLGYAQFPGGPPETDGVVILNTAFGTTGMAASPFDLGRTATHEVGHFFNLYHIWGLSDDCTGGDRVSDTPNAEGPNYGEPNFPQISCNNGPYGDMFMNYMDYVDDRVMCMFTAQQVARMMATLDGPRSGLGQS
jgi:hypothetical protein